VTENDNAPTNSTVATLDVLTVALDVVACVVVSHKSTSGSSGHTPLVGVVEAFVVVVVVTVEAFVIVVDAFVEAFVDVVGVRSTVHKSASGSSGHAPLVHKSASGSSGHAPLVVVVET
jgi:hypothetical protein